MLSDDQRTAIVRLHTDAVTELGRAQGLHRPIQSTHEGYGVLAEEARELIDAIDAALDWRKGGLIEAVRRKKRPGIRKELIQLMAMCYRFGVELDLMVAK